MAPSSARRGDQAGDVHVVDPLHVAPELSQQLLPDQSVAAAGQTVNEVSESLHANDRVDLLVEPHAQPLVAFHFPGLSHLRAPDLLAIGIELDNLSQLGDQGMAVGQAVGVVGAAEAL